MSIIYPNLIIAGAPKCGTTSLHDWLSLHPQVFGAEEKELRFMMDENYPLIRGGGYEKLGLQGYAKYFKNARSGGYNCIFETTPDYIYQNKAIDILSSQLTETRVAFILRRPADRVLSMYKFAQNNISILPLKMKFKEFVEEIQKQGPNGEPGGVLSNRHIVAHSIQHSKYADYLKLWFQRLDPKRISIWRFEDIVNDPHSFMKKFATHIGVEKSFYNDFSFPISNESFSVINQEFNRVLRFMRPLVPSIFQGSQSRRIYRAIVKRSDSTLSCKENFTPTLEKLDKFFEFDNERLETLTGLDFSSWSNER